MTTVQGQTDDVAQGGEFTIEYVPPSQPDLRSETLVRRGPVLMSGRQLHTDGRLQHEAGDQGPCHIEMVSHPIPSRGERFYRSAVA